MKTEVHNVCNYCIQVLYCSALIDESKHITTRGTLSVSLIIKCGIKMHSRYVQLLVILYIKSKVCTNKKVMMDSHPKSASQQWCRTWSHCRSPTSTATYGNTCPTVIFPLIWKGHNKFIPETDNIWPNWTK